MLLYLNTDNGDVMLEPYARAHTAISIPISGGQNEPCQLQLGTYVEGVWTPTRRPVGSAITLGCKPVRSTTDTTGRYEDDYLTSATTWTRPGADDGFYTADLPTDTADIYTALVRDGNAANDLDTIARTVCQVDYQDSGAPKPTKSQVFSITISNFVNDGGDPAVSVNSRVAILRSPDGTVTGYSAAADTDAARGDALQAAKTAATGGDLIEVGPLAAEVTASLAKNAVNWHFWAGARVYQNGDATMTNGIWDDGGSSMSFTVTGEGDFSQVATSASGGQFALVNVSHASSDITIHARDIFATADDDCIQSAIAAAAGICRVTARRIGAIGASTSGYSVWWTNGRLHVDAKQIIGSSSAIVSDVASAPTGDAFIRADEIAATLPISIQGSNSAAAIWIDALTIKNDTATVAYAIAANGANRLYVTAQKIFGAIDGNGDGLVYVDAQKIAAVKNGASGSPSLIGLRSSTGVARITIGHYDPVTFTGESIKITGGTVDLRGGDLTQIASGKGLEITGGTTRLQALRLNTAANSATSPITKSGGTLILDDVTLVAESSADSIAAGSAQNVKIYGTSVTNKAKNANITLQANTAGLIVSADVA